MVGIGDIFVGGVEFYCLCGLVDYCVGDVGDVLDV